MKLNKSKKKGKVHPSPSSSSSSSLTANDPISSLNHLLPTAILTLISVLSLQDRQVLAYMITHSLNSSSNSKNTLNNNNKFPTVTTHSPTFDCSCFACFSSYWHIWNSSPHSKLIDQAIEAFEEHLSTKEKPRKNTKREINKAAADVEERECSCSTLSSPPEVGDVEERESAVVPVEEERESGVQQQQHKGLARKVLPDFIGLFQSRLWNRLWGPNV